MPQPDAPIPATVRVWDLWQRLLHWGLAASMVVAWIAGEARPSLHERAGYAAMVLCGARIVLGFAGSRHARFRDFVHSPRVAWSYARSVARGHDKRWLGHNPLGGYMVIALLGSVSVAGLSGWLYSTDMFWGEAWLEWLHRGCAWAWIVLAGLHVSGVVFTSLRHRECLVCAMFTGRKRPMR